MYSFTAKCIFTFNFVISQCIQDLTYLTVSLFQKQTHATASLVCVCVWAGRFGGLLGGGGAGARGGGGGGFRAN